MAEFTISDGKVATPVGADGASAQDVFAVGTVDGIKWVSASALLERLLRSAGAGTALANVGDLPGTAGVVVVDTGDGTASRVSPAGFGGGGGGGANYLHTQSAASQTWTVNHNLGFRPGVSVRSPGGVEVDAEVTHTSVNQCVVAFSAPATGSVFCTV